MQYPATHNYISSDLDSVNWDVISLWSQLEFPIGESQAGPLKMQLALCVEGAMSISVRHFKLKLPLCHIRIQPKPLQKDPGAWKAGEGGWPSAHKPDRPRKREQTLGLHLDVGRLC